MDKKKVGIIGGTFNPIHNGHIEIALAAKNALELDFVLFMPNALTAYKAKPEVSDLDRENMVKAAIKDYPDFVYSDFEISQDVVTYTAVTLPAIKEKHPDWEIFYIVGSDSLCYMDKWYHPEIIFREAIIVAAGRATEKAEKVEEYRDFLISKYDADVRLIENEIIPVSSTEIRDAIRSGTPYEDMVPAGVATYIKTRGLYNGI